MEYLWNTYFGWFIAAIVIAVLITIISLIVILVNDLEIDEYFGNIGDFFGEKLGLLIFLIVMLVLIGLGGWLLSWLSQLASWLHWLGVLHWTNGLILLGGIAAGVLLVLLIFLIRFIFQAIQGNVSFGGSGIIDYEECTVTELKEYCKLYGHRGYSKMNKAELIALLESENDEDKDEYEDEKEETEDEIEEKQKRKNDTKQTTKTNNSQIPTIKIADIAGLDEAKKALEERVILPLKHKELYDKYGKSVGGGILLFGLPGTGKTMFAQAVATELDAKFFSIKCSDIESKWTGEAEQNVKKIFTDAKKCDKSVIFFDEFDSLGKRRNSENESGSNTVQEILTQMQGVEKSTNMLLVIAATNCPWAIDGALLRPGRFNEKIYIPLPDQEARLFILNKSLKKCPFATDVKIENIAKRLDGFSGADMVEFCEKIKMLLIRKEIAKDRPIITNEDIEAILKTSKTSILTNDIANMEKFLKNA